MASRYYPFLKAKLFEILSIERLDDVEKTLLIPFFDVPASTYEDDSAKLQIKIERLSKQLHKASASFPNGFFLDYFDIDPRIRLASGEHPYLTALRMLNDMAVTPVIGLDRDHEYLASSTTFSKETSLEIGLRILPEDLISVEDTISEIGSLLNAYEVDEHHITIFYDLRNLSDVHARIGKQVDAAVSLSKHLFERYQIKDVVITGSSYPFSLSSVIKTGMAGKIARLEPFMWELFSEKMRGLPNNFGDYCTISPDYTEISPKLFRTTMTARGVYTEKDNYYITRKKALEQHGYGQYFEVAKDIVTHADFRGKPMSHGDAFIFDVADEAVDSPGSPSTWIAASINSHMTFIVQTQFIVF